MAIFKVTVTATMDQQISKILLSRQADEISAKDRILIQDILDNDINGSLPEDEDLISVFSPITTDCVFRVPAVLTAEDMAKHSSQPVYHYIYDYQGTTSLSDLFLMPMWKILGRV